MPLESGKSRSVFEHNIKEEIAAGKPQKQAVAIAYAQQRRSDSERTDEILSHCDAFDRKDSKFSALEHSLAHKGGVNDPAAVAAEIGRQKLGQKEMTERSVAGRK